MRRDIAPAPRDRNRARGLASPRDVAIWLRDHAAAASSRLGTRDRERAIWEGAGASSWAEHEIEGGVMRSQRDMFTNAPPVV